MKLCQFFKIATCKRVKMCSECVQVGSSIYDHFFFIFFRIQVIPDTMLFATCSDDGTVKIWDCEKMEGKNVANRSRLTYNRLGKYYWMNNYLLYFNLIKNSKPFFSIWAKKKKSQLHYLTFFDLSSSIVYAKTNIYSLIKTY